MNNSIETETSPKGRLSIRAIAMPADTNQHGLIFGGWLMSQMDLAGGVHAYHRADGRVLTVAAEAMEFHRPVCVGDEVSCYTEIVKTGRTSVTIHIEAWVRRGGADLPQIRVTSANFTFVAVDENGNKRPLPPQT